MAMKFEGRLFQALSEVQLAEVVAMLSNEGFRIVSVLDRSNPRRDLFLIVVQREPELKIEVAVDPEATRKLEAQIDIHKLEALNHPQDHYVEMMRELSQKYGKQGLFELKKWAFSNGS